MFHQSAPSPPQLTPTDGLYTSTFQIHGRQYEYQLRVWFLQSALLGLKASTAMNDLD